VLREPTMLFGDGRDRAAADLAEAESVLGAEGQRLDFRRALGVDRQREVAGRLTPFAIDRTDVVAVIATVRQLRERGTEVVLVELPVPDRFRELYPDGPGQHQTVVDTIRALGEELDVEVIPASVAGPDLGFVDFTHLDQASAVAFSEAVGRELVGALGR
jgi:hypothetical protein